MFHTAAGDANDCIRRLITGGKGIDAAVWHHINRRHRHTGCDGHFFDHIIQTLFVKVGGVGGNQLASERFGNGFTAAAQRFPLKQAGSANHHEDAQSNQPPLLNGHVIEHRWSGGHAGGGVVSESDGVLILADKLFVAIPEHSGDQQIQQHNEGDDRERKQKNQLAGAFTGLILMAEEIHGDNLKYEAKKTSRQLAGMCWVVKVHVLKAQRRQNDTLGAAWNWALSSNSSSSASVGWPNIPANTTGGKDCR